MSTDPQFWALIWGTVIAAFSGLGIFLGWLVKRAWPFVQRVVRFIDQWHGTSTQPGVLDRLAAVEAELRPNGGGSIKDQITRMDARLNDISQKLRAVEPDSTNREEIR
ncbi:MAG TPA: hypothetical protein VF174_09640 [Micromonosporaceae bacterium]